MDIPIEVGFPNKDKVVVKGKGNEHPDYLSGDLVVIVTINEDKFYKRKRDDLHIT